MPALGFNRTISHAGRGLHVQIEDLGEKRGCFEVRIYEGGQVLFRKQVAHGAAPPHEPPEARVQRLKGESEKLLAATLSAIQRGKINLTPPS